MWLLILYELIISRMQYFFAADEDDNNAVVVRVLQILTIFVKYGYYDDSTDISSLLPAMYKLLNGSKDFPTRSVKLAIENPSLIHSKS